MPTFPGALSALGILRADVVKELSQSVVARASSRGDTLRSLERAFARIEREGLRDMRGEGFQHRRVRIERFFDMRYVGQAYELTIAAGGEFLKAFHREHERRYGYADPARAVEIVNVRARFTGRTATIDWPRQRLGSADARGAIVAHRNVQFAGKTRATAIYMREKLRPGNRVAGPAIVSEYSATTVVPPGWSARVDAFENLVLASGRRGEGN